MIINKNGLNCNMWFIKIRNVIIYTLFLYLVSCNNETEKKSKLNKYLNYSTVSNEKYKSDSLLIVDKLKVELHKREAFFDNTSYSDSTQIILDSIIYSPDHTKRAVLVIVKNKTIIRDSYYDGTVYLGTGLNDSLRLYWVGPSFTESDNKLTLSKIIKDYCYQGYNKGDTTLPTSCKYNLNDIRFWTCPIWNELVTRDAKKKAFEEESIKHPENVYDPKRSRYRHN